MSLLNHSFGDGSTTRCSSQTSPGRMIVIVAIAERINPQYARWNVARNDIATDLMHSLVSQILLPKVLELGLRIVMLAGAASLTQWLGFTLWPTRWPLLAQLALALLLSQFFEYWAHRAMHEVPLLWRLHATHHSPGRRPGIPTDRASLQHLFP